MKLCSWWVQMILESFLEEYKGFIYLSWASLIRFSIWSTIVCNILRQNLLLSPFEETLSLIINRTSLVSFGIQKWILAARQIPWNKHLVNKVSNSIYSNVITPSSKFRFIWTWQLKRTHWIDFIEKHASSQSFVVKSVLAWVMC